MIIFIVFFIAVLLLGVYIISDWDEGTQFIPISSEAKKAVEKEAVKKDDFVSSSVHGYGVSWACKTCGKQSSQLMDGVGLCCSETLQRMAKWAAEREQHRKDLVFAIQSRVLTEEEMAEVASYDYRLLVREMVPFNETELRQQFSNLLPTQFRIRAALTEARKAAERLAEEGLVK